MKPTAQAITESGSAGQIVDVWSRTSRRYRRRSVLMLLVLAILFAGLCCFTFWLRTGVYRPWSSDAYWEVLAQSFRATGDDQITLSDFLSSPINVKDVPIYSVIMGLLLASLSSIPLLVAILYRFPFSVAFAVMVMFLAVMPWLGITVLGGCVLMSLRPFRFSFRYASALVGLIPVAVYFVIASWEPTGPGPRLIRHQALLYAPWVLAVLGSCIICAVALAIARLINYRPGGIPPLLAMLFAIPVFLFHTQVGRDELEYRLLEREVGPGSRSMFVTIDVGAEADRAATRGWSELRRVSYDEIHRRELKEAVSRAALKAERDRARAVALCDAFILHFPKSRYVPTVLFLKGRTQDQRIQRAKLERDRKAEFRCDAPNRSSRTTWETLVEQFPDRRLTSSALYRLVILKARTGDMDAAIGLLEKLIQQFDITRSTTQPHETSAQSRGSVFRKASVSTGLGVDVTALVRQARRLREMLAACRDDTPKAYSRLFGQRPGRPDEMIHPARLLLWLDDADPHYKANLEGIARHFGDSQTWGYVEIRLALLEPEKTRRRIQRFQAAAQTLAGRPAGAMALYYLGDALEQDLSLDEAKTTFDDLTRLHPASCWAQEAKERLSSVSMLEATAE